MINILFLILTFPWLVSSDDLPECASMEENTATKRRQKVSLDISISAKTFSCKQKYIYESSAGSSRFKRVLDARH